MYLSGLLSAAVLLQHSTASTSAFKQNHDKLDATAAYTCDILVAGGSLASLAAAIHAANATAKTSAPQTVCYTDIT
jgi:alkyl hydroperoxide reductase subunit AhpF